MIERVARVVHRKQWGIFPTLWYMTKLTKVTVCKRNVLYLNTSTKQNTKLVCDIGLNKDLMNVVRPARYADPGTKE